MSRIHEAMRRAAETAGDSSQTVTVAGEDAGDINELTRESFPIELNSSRRVRAAMLVNEAPSPSANGARQLPTAVTAEPGTADRRGTTESREPFSFERIDAHLAGKIVVDAEISAASREQYRRLAASLHHAQAGKGVKVVMLTSAVMGEGKTLTASNLALTLSESYQKQVLLIDADLRRPSLNMIFKVRAAHGLSEGLLETAERSVPVHQVSSRLAILTAGRPTSDPIAALTSPRMRRLLDEARAAFDWIILDTPPVAMLPDANLLASMVDGAVLVVRAGSTSCELAQRAIDAIHRDRILGVVLNSARRHPGHNDHYDYYYAPSSQQTATS
jgi:capsular exopolysaccharide synthesis family protein